MGILQSASRTVLGIDVLFLLLLGFSFLYLDPGTRSYVMAQLTLIPVALTFLASVVLIYTQWDPFE
ncbi:hypothetical protein [Halopelagius longus]|uniref:Uncharacterized protein n=1 Tax=Halopelagius longus TaxID=1236180 RepID=A0A1H1G4U0_9EURY|nr:hypothetical protein [Halopelagius longus]RDI69861.1 hypothetical protein DWB78_17075 [Halopelagius longus]SDR07836.1 hypothetical protein SAMN05216278_3502 [Halopelagius longus]